MQRNVETSAKPPYFVPYRKPSSSVGCHAVMASIHSMEIQEGMRFSKRFTQHFIQALTHDYPDLPKNSYVLNFNATFSKQEVGVIRNRLKLASIIRQNNREARLKMIKRLISGK